jgi:hypothetical protein
MRPLALLLLGDHPILWLVWAAFSFLPVIVALARGHRHPWVILVVTVLFPVVGWIGGLIWAMAGRPRQELSAPPGSFVGMISPDGRWRWDGRRWVPLSGPPPPPR